METRDYRNLQKRGIESREEQPTSGGLQIYVQRESVCVCFFGSIETNLIE